MYLTEQGAMLNLYLHNICIRVGVAYKGWQKNTQFENKQMIKIKKFHKENKQGSPKEIEEDLSELRLVWQEEIGHNNSLMKDDSWFLTYFTYYENL